MEMQISTLPETDVEVVLVGRLDTLGVDAIETRFNAGALTGPRHTLLNLSAVTFVSSMGVRLLITAAKTKKARHQRLVMVVPPGPVREMLETAAIDTLIPMFTVRDEALAALAR